MFSMPVNLTTFQTFIVSIKRTRSLVQEIWQDEAFAHITEAGGQHALEHNVHPDGLCS